MEVDMENIACASSSSDGNVETENTTGFVVDTAPSGKHDRLMVPDYECKRKYTLVGDLVKDLDESQGKRRRNFGGGSTCWNCGEQGHSNRDCPMPVSHKNLARNRQQFLNNRSARNVLVRYHTDIEQKYDHFKPGVISSRLQTALGLTNTQVPRHIYNMRLLGYPPGWLEEAKVLHSGITLFDAKGSAVADPDDEEGEVVDNTANRHKYDINKLIKYPGFNIPLPPEVVDEWEERHLPPMRPDDSFENLIICLKPNEAKAYHRRKIPVIPSATPPHEESTSSQDSTEANMECEETPELGFLPEDNCGFVPALPEEPQPLPPPPPPPEDPEDGECVNQLEGAVLESELTSSTLDMLEEQKKSILEALNSENSSDSTKSADMKSPSVDRVKKGTTQTPSPNLGRMKSVELGTPILKSVSPYSKLPSSESFSQNICDVINFENLPDSTGIYDKMLGVIGKVRLAVKKLQQDHFG